MNETQQDFIKTVENIHPFLSTYDAMTDAISYSLDISEENQDGDWETVIGGKKFVCTKNDSFWDGKSLTRD